MVPTLETDGLLCKHVAESLAGGLPPLIATVSSGKTPSTLDRVVVARTFTVEEQT